MQLNVHKIKSQPRWSKFPLLNRLLGLNNRVTTIGAGFSENNEAIERRFAEFNQNIYNYYINDPIIRRCVDVTADECTSEDYELLKNSVVDKKKKSAKQKENQLANAREFLDSTGFDDFLRKCYVENAIFGEFFIELSLGKDDAEIPSMVVLPTEEMRILYDDKNNVIGYEQKRITNQ